MRARLILLVVAVGCGEPSPNADAGDDRGRLDGGGPSDTPPIDAPSDGGVATDTPALAGFRDEPSLPHPLQEITGTLHEGRIVIAGGIDERARVVTEVWAFDGTSWTALPSLPAPRHHAMLVSLDGALYLIGGMQSLAFQALDTVFVLRSGESAWQSAPPLPHPLAAAVGAVVGSEVVLVGGQTDRDLSDRPLVGSPSTGTYREGAVLPDPREHVAGFADGTDVWLVAGRDYDPSRSTNAIHIYDVPADAWRDGPALAMERGGHSASLVAGEMFVAGGELSGVALDSLERRVDGPWASGTLPTRRHGHTGVVFSGRVYLIGGADRPLLGATDTVESWGP